MDSQKIFFFPMTSRYLLRYSLFACFHVFMFVCMNACVYAHTDIDTNELVVPSLLAIAVPVAVCWPHCYRVTLQELHSICARASQWHGPSGAHRKLIISNYVERDPLDPSFEETTKHYAIYEIDGDKKSVYRHFLRTPNGAILEVFDQFAKVHANKYQGRRWFLSYFSYFLLYLYYFIVCVLIVW